MRKGQIALEFMSMVIIGIALGLVILVIIVVIMQDTREEQTQEETKQFGFQLQRELILASEVHDGYVRNIYIPEYIGKEDYEINNTDRILILTVKDIDYPFPIPKINGTLLKGDITIKNIKGEIVIE